MFNIFLPTIVNDYYIFEKNTVYIYIVGMNVYCFLVSLKGKKRAFKGYVYKKISFDGENDDFLSIYSTVIHELIHTWKFNNLKLIISATNAFSKVLKFPFSDIEKIKMILPFEIEQYLPFVLSDCIVDCVLAQLETKKNSDISVLGIALKQDIIDVFKSVFKNIQLPMNFMTLDIAEVIAFHEYTQILTPHIVMFKNIESITLLFYNNNHELYDIRVIHAIHESVDNDAASMIAEYLFSIKEDEGKKEESASEENNTSPEKKTEKNTKNEHMSNLTQDEIEESIIDIMEHAKDKNNEIKNNQTKINKSNEFGFNSEEIKSAITITLKAANIAPENVTIYILDYEKFQNDINVMLNGINMHVVGYSEVVTDVVKQKQYGLSESFNNDVEGKQNFVDSHISDLIKIISLNVFLINSFNLNTEEQVKERNNSLFKQIITGFSLGAVIIIMLIALNVMRLNSLNKEKIKADQEALTFLKKEFSLSPKFLSSLEVALKEVNTQVDKMHSDLPVIATEAKDKFLLSLIEISDKLSKDVKGLTIQRIVWSNGLGGKKDSLSISGSVGDFASLSLLEEGLRKTELFVTVPKIQDLHFNLNLMLLTK